MNAADAMTRPVHVCHLGDDLAQVARTFWDRNCGSLPVLDANDHVVGVVTDRDVCMAALTRGRPLHALGLERTMSDQLHSCRPDDDTYTVRQLMREHGIQRLPVTTEEGELLGIISLSDLARLAAAETDTHRRHEAARDIAMTLASLKRTQVGEPEAATPVTRASRSPAASVRRIAASGERKRAGVKLDTKNKLDTKKKGKKTRAETN